MLLTPISVFRKNLVDLCFADRTFSCINNIIRTLSFGRLLDIFYKFLYFKESENVDRFMKSKAFKIISSDPRDIIVSDLASLKSGIAEKLISSFKSQGYLEVSFVDSNTNPRPSSDKLLHTIFPDREEYHNFLDSLNYVVDKVKNYKYDNLSNVTLSPRIDIHLKSDESVSSNNLKYDRLAEDNNTSEPRMTDIVLTIENDTSGFRDESQVFYSVFNSDF